MVNIEHVNAYLKCSILVYNNMLHIVLTDFFWHVNIYNKNDDERLSY